MKDALIFLVEAHLKLVLDYSSKIGLIILSGAVYTRVEVHGMNSELSKLVEQPWLQLMYCTICLLYGCNFR